MKNLVFKTTKSNQKLKFNFGKTESLVYLDFGIRVFIIAKINS